MIKIIDILTNNNAGIVLANYSPLVQLPDLLVSFHRPIASNDESTKML